MDVTAFFICLSVPVFVCVFLSLSLCVCVHVCPCVNLTVCLSHTHIPTPNVRMLVLNREFTGDLEKSRKHFLLVKQPITTKRRMGLGEYFFAQWRYYWYENGYYKGSTSWHWGYRCRILRWHPLAGTAGNNCWLWLYPFQRHETTKVAYATLCLQYLCS